MSKLTRDIADRGWPVAIAITAAVISLANGGFIGNAQGKDAPAADDAANPGVTFAMNRIDARGVGAAIGTIHLSDGADGLVITPDLAGLPSGSHGFHLHQNPDCGAALKDGKMTAGEAAGEHFDPSATGKHAGPKGSGHAGDLPRLAVTGEGKATQTLTVARLKVADVRNLSLMIHAERDDYAAHPGGARIACGVVK